MFTCSIKLKKIFVVLLVYAVLVLAYTSIEHSIQCITEIDYYDTHYNTHYNTIATSNMLQFTKIKYYYMSRIRTTSHTTILPLRYYKY